MTNETCPELFYLGEALSATIEHHRKWLANPQKTELELMRASLSLDKAKTALSDHRQSCPICRERWVEYLVNSPFWEGSNHTD
jgi:hypothetical protein